MLQANTRNGAENIRKDAVVVPPKKRKSKQQGLTNKHHEKMAMQEEHIMDTALNGKNYCSAIHRRQRYFVAGASVRMRGARMLLHTTDDSWINVKRRHVPLLRDEGDSS
jgi:hypothetical protein